MCVSVWESKDTFSHNAKLSIWFIIISSLRPRKKNKEPANRVSLSEFKVCVCVCVCFVLYALCECIFSIWFTYEFRPNTRALTSCNHYDHDMIRAVIRVCLRTCTQRSFHIKWNCIIADKLNYNTMWFSICTVESHHFKSLNGSTILGRHIHFAPCEIATKRIDLAKFTFFSSFRCRRFCYFSS